MGITYGDHLIDSGHYDITPEQEREIEAREAPRAATQSADAFHGWKEIGPLAEYPDYYEITGGTHADGTYFSVSGHCGKERAQIMAASFEAIATIKRFCEMIDNDPERFNIAEPSCNKCTSGCTPYIYDKGLCAYHTAKAIISRIEGAR